MKELAIERHNCPVAQAGLCAPGGALAVALRAVVGNDELLEVGRKAVEDLLVEMRDSRMFTIRNNGCVIKERDGRDSHVIRCGPEQAIRVALVAIADHLEKPRPDLPSPISP